jgi:hypothetical protein
MRPWHLGNTTVRSPFRLRDGLVALSHSPLQGNLRGREQEIALRDLLGANGIVELGEDTTYSVGRKWRSALNKLGFLYPEVPTKLGIPQNEIGAIDTITPNGLRLIKAESVPAMQECFLRALAAYYIPSVSEPDYTFSVFSPLRHTLTIMLELARVAGESTLNFIEMAVVVQLSSSDENMADLVARVLALREQRLKADKKRRFDQQVREEAAKAHDYKEQTFNDYADTNFRYLKASGLVVTKGRGIALAPEKRILIEKLVQDTALPDSPTTYFRTLCNGAVLPTDQKDSALAVLHNLLEQLQERSIPFETRGLVLDTPADIAVIRHEIETLIAQHKEEEYAARQVSEWEEIAAFMELLINRKFRMQFKEDEIRYPQNEAPAYFEWILWRAFLAINHLENKPYKARRFNIDQDFLPVGTAPGNGPDLIFEFKDFVIAVEVTLTDNSRQEAAEGEPVRRHVADLMTYHRAQTGKPVYGLFIANRIDSNTAETFRIGVWYTRDDAKMRLDIVPFTLMQFRALFHSMLANSCREAVIIRELLDECSALRTEHEAPQWKTVIQQTVDAYIARVTH